MRPARTATAVVLATVLAWTGAASAETATLKRGAMDLVGAPLDLAFTPYTATSTFVRKFYMSDKQSVLDKVLLTPLTGVVYATCCVMGITGAVTVMRVADGILNVPLGLAMLGAEKEPDTALYEPTKGGAVVDYKGIYFGTYNCEGYFQ
jgi:hypothetical protein